MFVNMRVAVVNMVFTDAGICQFQVALDEQQRENYIADTAGQPDSYEQGCKYSNGGGNRYLGTYIHQQI